MIARLRELFSFSVTNTQQKNNINFNIETVNCPLKEMMCEVHHSAINKSFLEFEKYRKEKDFKSSIETLQSAFHRTIELMDHPCTNCAQQLRSSIFESLENIHSELEKMTKGFFGKKLFKSSYLRADNVLKEFKTKGIHSTNQINDNKKRFLGNHLN